MALAALGHYITCGAPPVGVGHCTGQVIARNVRGERTRGCRVCRSAGCRALLVMEDMKMKWKAKRTASR